MDILVIDPLFVAQDISLVSIEYCKFNQWQNVGIDLNLIRIRGRVCMKLVTCMHTIKHIYTLSHNMMDNGISFMNSTMQRSNIRFSCVPFTIASVVPQYGLSELRRRYNRSLW